MIDVGGWSPEPVETAEAIGAAPSAALAGVLDVEPPGEELPPLWHWLHFLERPAQHELGPDGHPLAGHFLPPIPDRRRMFAGGRFRVREPLRAGDTVTRRTELASTAVKQGRSGEMLFVTVRHTFLRDGAEIAVEEQDLVYRSGDTASRPPEVSFAAPDTKAPWTLPVTADPVLLFRFSALTYNAHRIHYDETYATEVEGHGGLVVHGPLLAILCLELPRRAGLKVNGLSFRARRPVYARQPFVAAGSPDGELSIEAPGGVTAMTATFSTA
ncbi:MaoC family dehydratase N-terminal domain-containing protein [Actinomadura nitritigenes]|uniref:MaoC family dehydratase N-terminal domain-containing protein n=1 Tax=Actinomadura nitritigenes TaxID=134602 RepID=A0ABS3R6P8_9ACTN|nr:MaoC family dehydratase N-terminal domain-containing protein [Actinomadura nitritigenes]MBO2441883.1 MaoC family dehydratase N-terminal domain-containing protein [Actinomadura nitritigenes]